MPRAALLSVAGLLVATSLAQANDVDDVVKLGSTSGLTGFQDVVSARTPGKLSARGGLRYLFVSEKREFRQSNFPQVELEKEQQLHEARLWGGVSTRISNLELDFGGSVAYRFLEHDDPFAPGEMPPRSRSAEHDGYGDVQLAAKLSLPMPDSLEWLAFAPYAIAVAPTAREEVEQPASLETGLALSFWDCFWSETVELSLHGNVAGLLLERGTQALRYRLGVSLAVGEPSLVLARLFVYGDGLSYEGGPSSDLDLALGVQLLVARFFTVEVGGSYRFHSAGFRSPELRSELARQQVFDRHPDETFGMLQVALGVVF